MEAEEVRKHNSGLHVHNCSMQLHLSETWQENLNPKVLNLRGMHTPFISKLPPQNYFLCLYRSIICVFSPSPAPTISCTWRPPLRPSVAEPGRTFHPEIPQGGPTLALIRCAWHSRRNCRLQEAEAWKRTTTTAHKDKKQKT